MVYLYQHRVMVSEEGRSIQQAFVRYWGSAADEVLSSQQLGGGDHVTGQADWAVPAQVLLREVDGEMVLLNLDTEQYYGLDPVGAEMVRRITTTPYEEALASLLVDYSADEARITADLHRLLAELSDAGLLMHVGG
jgi:hypothetical protein